MHRRADIGGSGVYVGGGVLPVAAVSLYMVINTCTRAGGAMNGVSHLHRPLAVSGFLVVSDDTGSIPKELAGLAAMQELKLFNNRLTGEV